MIQPRTIVEKTTKTVCSLSDDQCEAIILEYLANHGLSAVDSRVDFEWDEMSVGGIRGCVVTVTKTETEETE